MTVIRTERGLTARGSPSSVANAARFANLRRNADAFELYLATWYKFRRFL